MTRALLDLADAPLRAIGEALLHKEASTRRPPQLVPTILINAKAVIIIGRWQRRFAKQLEAA